MDIVFPRVVQAERFDENRLREICHHLYYQWHSCCEDRQPYRSIGISHAHDPEWRNRFLSIQGAHDGNHLFWKATKTVCTFMFGVV